MLEQLYEWIRSIAYFMVFSAVLTHLIPGQAYRKYIRFFTGLLLVLLLLHPVMEMLGMGEEFLSVYRGTAYEEELRQIREAGAYLKNIGAESSSQEEAGLAGEEEETGEEEGDDNRISVEEIRIGQE